MPPSLAGGGLPSPTPWQRVPSLCPGSGLQDIRNLVPVLQEETAPYYPSLLTLPFTSVNTSRKALPSLFLPRASCHCYLCCNIGINAKTSKIKLTWKVHSFGQCYGHVPCTVNRSCQLLLASSVSDANLGSLMFVLDIADTVAFC